MVPTVRVGETDFGPDTQQTLGTQGGKTLECRLPTLDNWCLGPVIHTEGEAR